MDDARNVCPGWILWVNYKRLANRYDSRSDRRRGFPCVEAGAPSGRRLMPVGHGQALAGGRQDRQQGFACRVSLAGKGAGRACATPAIGLERFLRQLVTSQADLVSVGAHRFAVGALKGWTAGGAAAGVALLAPVCAGEQMTSLHQLIVLTGC